MIKKLLKLIFPPKWEHQEWNTNEASVDLTIAHMTQEGWTLVSSDLNNNLYSIKFKRKKS